MTRYYKIEIEWDNDFHLFRALKTAVKELQRERKECIYKPAIEVYTAEIRGALNVMRQIKMNSDILKTYKK